MLRPHPLRLFCAGLLGVLALGSLLIAPARTQAALPPWYTPTPGSQASPNGDPGNATASIELTVVSPPPEAWAVVQWQDPAGAWHAVQGWQGPLDPNGKLQWGVASSEFGQGTFRWVVFAQRGEPIWGSSASFRLPAAKGEEIAVTVSPAAPPGITPARVVSQWAFTADQPAFRTYAAGCGQYAIAGQVFDRKGQPLNSYRLQLLYPDGDKEIIPSGGAPDYGRSGFGFLLGRRRPNRLYQLQLLAPGSAGQPLSAVVPIVFTGACDQNLVWVVFRQVSP